MKINPISHHKLIMKKPLLSLFFTVAGSLAGYAEILTVDNRPGGVAMYSDFSSAYAAAEDGDTFVLAGSGIDYGQHQIKKIINVVGPGNLYQNFPFSLNPDSVRIGLDFSKLDGGSSGSTVTGVAGNLSVQGDISGVRFENCWLTGGTLLGPNTNFLRCYIPTIQNFGDGSIFDNSIIIGISTNNSKRFEFTNCYVNKRFSGGSQLAKTYRNCLVNSFGSATYINCLIDTELTVGGSGPEAFQLTSDQENPAKGATREQDLGAFGGATPFVLAANSHLPRIDSLIVSPQVTPTSGLRIQLEAVAGGE